MNERERGQDSVSRTLSGKLKGFWASLPKNRDFVLLLMGGKIASQLGDELSRIAVLWLVLQTTGSPVAMSTLMVINRIVSFLGSFVGGVTADRVNRKRLMVGVDLVRALLFGLLAWRVWTGQVSFPEIVLVLATACLLETFFAPALVATIPTLVKRSQLAPAVGFGQALSRISGVSGPAIGGFITKLFGYVIGIVANALSFLVSAVTILLIRKPTETQVSPEGHDDAPLPSQPSSFINDFIEGATFVLRTRTVAGVFLLWGASNLAFGPQGVLMPFFVQAHLGGDAMVFGMIWAAFAIGTILGSLSPAVIPRRWFQWGSPQLFLMYALQGLLVVAFAASPSPAWAYGCFAAFGLVNGLVNVMLTTIVMQKTPNERLGRVSSLVGIVNGLALTISFAISGWLGAYFGAARVIGGGGILLVGASVIAWRVSHNGGKQISEQAPSGREESESS